jgi:hypothetical protein
MSWPRCVLVALITAVAGSFMAGAIAILSVDWYHISGREGASGYFVVAVAFLGFIVGLILGAVVSRTVAAGASPGVFKALGIALAILVAVAGTAGGTARVLADVPPRIGGEALMLAVEVRWPEGQQRSPATEPGEGILTLGSVNQFSHVQRASVRGPLWKEDARQVDGRWIVPGAVEVFTSRGVRSLAIAVDTKSLAGFIVPLPGHPGKRDLEWSEWLPVSLDGAPSSPDKFSYRYRVQPRSAPVRTETFGPFEIATIASQFYDAAIGGRAVLTAAAEFAIRYRGHAIRIEGDASSIEHADAVAAVPGPEPALLVHLFDPGSPGNTYLLVGGGEQLRVEPIAKYNVSPTLLTSDTTQFRLARGREIPRGRIDRLSFEEPGIFLIGSNLVDTRHLTVRHFSAHDDKTAITSVRPLAISPDERSFITFAYGDGSEEHPVLAVTDIVADTMYTLPVDPARMRYATLDALDPGWVLHHFIWIRGDGGADRLVARKDFVPLPYHGKLSGEGDGLSYRLEPAGDSLRDALIEFLVKEFKGEALSFESWAYHHPVRINGQVVNVASSGDFSYVAVTMDSSATDQSLLATIAKRFDAELTTGKYDALFGKVHRGT